MVSSVERQKQPAETFSFGKSIIVPSVQELAKGSINEVPARYVHQEQEPAVFCIDGFRPVPVIDLQKLADVELGDSELERLHAACKEWGFFQIINHGISTSLLDQFKAEVESFFRLSYEEKQRLWQKPDDYEGFGQLFVVSENQKLDWSDMFHITTLPSNLRKLDLYEKLPPKLRETMEAYCIQVKELAIKLLSNLAKALKMDAREMEELFGDGIQFMRMNCYPPCPDPHNVIGFSPHSDADALTILFQLDNTDGLQIRKEGQWIPVSPLSNALIVNVGDMMEIVSNGTYRSIEHRAAVNSMKERLSVATFYSSCVKSELGPAPSLIGPHNPAIFRTVPTEKYYKDFFATKLHGKSYLDLMRMEKEKEDDI